MGYSLHPGLVEGNSDLLDQILLAVSEGITIEFPCPAGDLSSEQYRLRRILRACDVYKDVCEGKYRGLGQNTTISTNLEDGRIVVRPRFKSPLRAAPPQVGGEISLAPQRRSTIEPVDTPLEGDSELALQILALSKSRMEWLEFLPEEGFDLSLFHSQARALGWKVSEEPIPLGGGRVAFGAERIEREGFSAIFGGVDK